VLENASFHATLPASDLARARQFYEGTLGLHPVDENPGGVWYEGGGTRFLLFPSGGVASGTHTQIGFRVDDIDATVRDLESRGVTFESYDTPHLKTVNGIADVAPGVRSAWFKDTEGNMIGVVQMAEVAGAAH
jgi:catechol 2,3-dioxygenase-like lactoylglutathione lyase family enzyme